MSERTAIEMIGWSSGLKRWISGSLTSRFELGADLLDLLAHVLQGRGGRHRKLELGDDDRLAFQRARGQAS